MRNNENDNTIYQNLGHMVKVLSVKEEIHETTVSIERSSDQ